MSTVTHTVTTTVASASATATFRAAPQGGILEGSNPTHWDSKNPIILFIIQAGIIIIFCRLLHYPLSKLRQPRVIAEVIGGILLGPSVMGRIPGFSNAIFPQSSIPSLNLVANLGLILFLFLVGLEVDLRYFVSNWRVAVSVGALGMILPFGLGCAIAWGLYNEFRNEPGTVPIAFPTYMLFIGVAMSITAFPVLCRILTELKLLRTPVGVIVLSAGVGNDVVGWILLALCVSLVNAASGLTALWVVLTCLGYGLFLVFAVRPAFIWVLRRTGALQDGPSQGIVTLTLMIALTSSFFTGVIGVHPIFGAFMAGLICPHEGGFAIKLTEVIEDLISALFLPLYFALSGLSTDLGLLDNGITWAYVVGVISIAFFAKIVGGTLAAKANGLVWRESFTIGVLMSCKGLVELIVLNIGLQAKILSTRTFTIFVVMAVVTTIATTPLTSLLYPPEYQRKLQAWKRGEIDWDSGAALDRVSDVDTVMAEKLETTKISRLLVHLRLDNIAPLLALVSLFGGTPSALIERKHPQHGSSSLAEHAPPVEFEQRKRPIEVHGVRLIPITERGSTVMKVSEAEELSFFDPVLNAFRVLGQLYNLAVSGEVCIIPESSFSETIASKAADEMSDLLLLPWSETGSMSEAQTISNESEKDKLASETYTSFVRDALTAASCNTAIFINKGFSGSLKTRPNTLQRSMSAISIRSHRDHATVRTGDRSHHIFAPFFGGADSRVALRLVLQLCANPEITATIIHFKTTCASLEIDDSPKTAERIDVVATKGATTSSTAVPVQEDSAAFFATMHRSLPAELQLRVIFDTITTDAPIADAAAKAQSETGQNPRNGGDVVVVGRHADLFRSDGGCLGSAANSILDGGARASLIVVQAKGSEPEMV